MVHICMFITRIHPAESSVLQQQLYYIDDDGDNVL